MDIGPAAGVHGAMSCTGAACIAGIRIHLLLKSGCSHLRPALCVHVQHVHVNGMIAQRHHLFCMQAHPRMSPCMQVGGSCLRVCSTVAAVTRGASADVQPNMHAQHNHACVRTSQLQTPSLGLWGQAAPPQTRAEQTQPEGRAAMLLQQAGRNRIYCALSSYY